MDAQSHRAVLLAVGVTLLLWASAFVAIRFVGRSLSPGPLALGRLAVASLVLSAVVLARRERPPAGRAAAFAVLSGLLWLGVYNLALNAAERRIDAGTSALLVNTGPIFIALLAGRALREGYPRALVGGCAVAFTGAVLIGIGVSRHGLQATWGAGLCVIAALGYAAGVVAQKPALRSASPLAVTWLACTVATLACLPYAPELIDQAGRAGADKLAWTAYLGLGPTAVGFGCWAFALARTSAGRLGVTTYLVPPLVVLLGWAFLAEAPPLLAAPGGVLCLAGVALSRRRAAAGGIAPPPAAQSVLPAEVATSGSRPS